MKSCTKYFWCFAIKWQNFIDCDEFVIMRADDQAQKRFWP